MIEQNDTILFNYVMYQWRLRRGSRTPAAGCLGASGCFVIHRYRGAPHAVYRKSLQRLESAPSGALSMIRSGRGNALRGDGRPGGEKFCHSLTTDFTTARAGELAMEKSMDSLWKILLLACVLIGASREAAGRGARVAVEKIFLFFFGKLPRFPNLFRELLAGIGVE